LSDNTTKDNSTYAVNSDAAFLPIYRNFNPNPEIPLPICKRTIPALKKKKKKGKREKTTTIPHSPTLHGVFHIPLPNLPVDFYVGATYDCCSIQFSESKEHPVKYNLPAAHIKSNTASNIISKTSSMHSTKDKEIRFTKVRF